MYDVAIVGAGPIGLVCAIEAQKRGFRAVVFEKGCLTNSIYRYPTNMTFFSTPDLVEIGSIPFVCRDMKPTRHEALEYYRRVMEFYGLDVRLYEEVTEIGGLDGEFQICTSKAKYEARKVIVAIGFFEQPRMMNVPGEHLNKVIHYYRDPHPFVAQKLLVVGSGNSAVIAALECHRHGAQVSVAVRSNSYHEGVKYWLLPDMENRIKQGDIKAYFDTRVAEILPDSVRLIDREGIPFVIENDFVLAMTGYEPHFDFLCGIGIQIGPAPNRIPCHDPVTYQTNRRGVYIAGVVVGGLVTNQWFIENSRGHAIAIFDHISLQYS